MYAQNIWSVYSSLVKNTGWFEGDGRSESRNIKWNNKSTILCITNSIKCNKLIEKETNTKGWLRQEIDDTV